jgi:diphosphomevalonate decarboxylase
MNGKLHEKYTREAVAKLPARKETIRTGWRSPSNIAIVKYWGKSAGQIPGNPSLSFSLKEAVTEMLLTTLPHSGDGFSLEYSFEGKENEAFGMRIRKYLSNILPYFPFLNGFSLDIQSRNTFPHSSGIASSASSMSALALCICSLEEMMLGRRTDEEFYTKASYMARLGSGSASRSVYGGFASWGSIEGKDETSDEFASALEIKKDTVFSDLYDAVLIVSPGQKKVSSSQGHSLMDSHPFAVGRYKQAGKNLLEVLQALENGDVETFIRITENEALSLHGLMMSSDPGFILLEPSTIEIISRIRKYREETGSFVTFTIDAGPNVHLIYPGAVREDVLKFIRDELLEFCHDGNWIDDRIGEGPEELRL